MWEKKVDIILFHSFEKSVSSLFFNMEHVNNLLMSQDFADKHDEMKSKFVCFVSKPGFPMFVIAHLAFYIGGPRLCFCHPVFVAASLD